MINPKKLNRIISAVLLIQLTIFAESLSFNANQRQISPLICPCVCSATRNALYTGRSKALCATSKCILPFEKGRTCCYKGNRPIITSNYQQHKNILVRFLKRFFKARIGNCINIREATLLDRAINLRMTTKRRCVTEAVYFQDAFEALRTMPGFVSIFLDDSVIDFNPTILTTMTMEFFYDETSGMAAALDTCRPKRFNAQVAAARYTLYFISEGLECDTMRFQLSGTSSAVLYIILSEGCIVERRHVDMAYQALKQGLQFDEVFNGTPILEYQHVGLSRIELPMKNFE